MTTSSPPAPRGWANTRLDRVASVSARIGWKALTADEYVPEGYVFLATPNIKSDQIDFENVNFITESRYEESPELKLQVGDVLLSKDGTLGITNVIRDLPRPATVNGSIAVIRSQAMVPAYLRYVLASDFLQGRIAAYRAGMGVPHLFQADIKKFPLPQPPPTQQQAIADYLDVETARIDALVARRRRLIDLLDERRSVVVADLTGGDIPNGQAGGRTRLKFAVGRPTSGNRDHSFTSDDSGIPCLRGLNIKPGWVDQANLMRISEADHGEHAATTLHAGDVVIVRSGNAGTAAVVPPELDGANCVDLVIVRQSANVEPKYLECILNSPQARMQAEMDVFGATLTHFNAVDIAELSLFIPSVEEQAAIVSKLVERTSRIDIATEAMQRQVGVLLERRQALITAAVTGQLAIPGLLA